MGSSRAGTTDAPTTGGNGPDDVERLRSLVQTFVRRFGLLVTNRTPCGHPISPTHAHALMALAERIKNGETSSQSDLGRILGIDKSNVARLAARMEEAGHAVQEAPEHDGRSRVVRLTGAGSRLATKIERASRDRFARVADHLRADERRALFTSLERLNAAIAALESDE